MIGLSLVNAGMNAGENNVMYVAVGIGAFVFTTMGSALMRCFLSARRKRKEEKRLAGVVTESLAKMMVGQLTATADVEKGPLPVAEPVKVEIIDDVVDTPRLVRSQSVESVKTKRVW